MNLSTLYDSIVFKRPILVVLTFIVLMAVLSPFASNFRLDASSDSLVLENDKSLRYFREEVSKYSTADLLVLTYAPEQDLFSDAALNDLSKLRDNIAALDGVDSIVSILDVPLVQSPPVNLAELTASPQYLLDEETDRSLAKKELRNSELYRDFLVSDDYSTTALAISLKGDPEVQELHSRREELRQMRANEPLSREQQVELEQVSLEYQTKLSAFQDRQATLIETVRGYANEARDSADLFLGGLPMIVADSIAFINADVANFGGAALLVILVILVVAFRQFGWVMMPLLSCFITGFLLVCLLGLLNWPISVVSSNFLSLLLIITLSLNIHLIVRYRELVHHDDGTEQLELLSETVRTKFIPCLYTALTTMVAFASLIVSGIRPVIDFGYIMCLGILISMLTTFTLFPALATYIKPRADRSGRDAISKSVLHWASIWQDKIKASSLAFGLIAVVAIYGIANLTVENRFIDYFKPETEIYQGMYEIDTKLGGTTPLDIILDAPKSFFDQANAATTETTTTTGTGTTNGTGTTTGTGTLDDPDADFLAEFEDDQTPISSSSESDVDSDFLAEFEDDFMDDESLDEPTSKSSEDEVSLSVSSYWFNKEGLDRLKAIQADLEAIPETGKVLSLASTMSVFENLRDAKPLDNIDLGFLVNVMPAELRQTLFKPYIAPDGNQVHINIRVFETARGLDRNQLISDIRNLLVDEHGLTQEQVNISGMLVLYNNMLNSLFQSQILTLGTVFVVILFMFIFLFRNLKLALITIVPNIFSAAVVLGIMGVFGIPLDLMTITIAAISVGIAVDNSIHFVARYRDEWAQNNDYELATDVATQQVGQAMFYTTVVITAGFLIMVLSNFVPTMYFGMLTALAMVTALFANLVMLPILIKRFKP